MAWVFKGPQQTHRNRLNPCLYKRVDGLLNLAFIQLDHHRAVAIHALRDTANVSLRNNGIRLLAFWEMNHLVDVTRRHAARPAHDVNHILVAFRGDQAHFGTPALNQGIGAHGRTVGQYRDVRTELLKTKIELFGRNRHRIDHALREIWRRRR